MKCRMFATCRVNIKRPPILQIRSWNVYHITVSQPEDQDFDTDSLIIHHGTRLHNMYTACEYEEGSGKDLTRGEGQAFNKMFLILLHLTSITYKKEKQKGARLEIDNS